MKKNLLVLAAMSGMLYAGNVNAQEAVVVEETTVVAIPESKDIYTPASWRDGWFLQAGAGVQSPFVENKYAHADGRHVTAVYNLGVGRWFSPYMGFRFSALYGSIHWNSMDRMARAKQANVNLDFMWDMCNSIAGYNPNRVFSVIPFVGLGGTFVWDYKNNPAANDEGDHGIKRNQWLLPVSAGIQFRFRLCSYVDFFLEGRGSFYGDNYNNVSYGRPVDINVSAIGGLNIRFDGNGMTRYNPADYAGYVATLNNNVNDLRAALAVSEAARAAAEAQLPCPEVTVTETATIVQAPLLSTVRFKINSAYVSSEEMVNVYNMAEYLKANPGTSIVVRGYADEGTGTPDYNLKLSERRAQAVADILTSDYGISADRLTIEAKGSATQPYEVNNWNRIVIFAQPE